MRRVVVLSLSCGWLISLCFSQQQQQLYVLSSLARRDYVQLSNLLSTISIRKALGYVWPFTCVNKASAYFTPISFYSTPTRMEREQTTDPANKSIDFIHTECAYCDGQRQGTAALCHHILSPPS